MVFDWFWSVHGAPLVCIIQVNQSELKNPDAQIKLPDYLKVAKDITDQEEFKPRALARSDFRMDSDLLKLTHHKETAQTTDFSDVD